jgi:hypothetical protein
MKSTGRLLAALLCLVAGTAHSAFHLWRMSEIFSSPDGTIQFVELAVFSDGEEFIAGHTLVSSAPGATTRTYAFASNLPAGTANKTFLVGTQQFATLSGVAPDYIIPDGFLFPGGGMLNFADVDVWTYPAMPTGAEQSRYRNGTAADNTPRNFAGATGFVSTPLNFQALWWAAPAGSESGWGLNLTHQGDILFGTWFTYDNDGSAMWLVAPSSQRLAANFYRGPLYRTTGPPFNSVPFNPSGIGVTLVGDASFQLDDHNNGFFSYLVNGVEQTKAITRQVFDVNVSTCGAGGAAGAAPNYQDLWWRSPAESESGWGVNLTHQGDILFATWFTYDATGKGMWIVMPAGRLANGAYSGALYRTTGAPFHASPWNPASVVVTEVGSGSFTFSGLNAGTFAYTVNGISQSKSITRQVYSAPLTVCR